MGTERQKLLREIDVFLRSSGISESYFGQLAARNSKLVERMRKGGSVRLDTAEKIRDLIRKRRDVAA